MTTTLASKPDLRRRYAGDTRQRMDRAMSDLRAFQQAGADTIDRVLEGLRVQEEASRLAGFRGIARLCRDLEDCLKEARDGKPPWLAAAAATGSEICRAIQLHADAVGTGLLRALEDDQRRPTGAKHANPCTRPATMPGETAEQKGGRCGRSSGQ